MGSISTTCTARPVHRRGSGLMLVNVGHGRAEIADAAAEQMRKLAYVSAARHTTVPAVRWSEEMRPADARRSRRVFFSSGGSEAVGVGNQHCKTGPVPARINKRYNIMPARWLLRLNIWRHERDQQPGHH